LFDKKHCRQTIAFCFITHRVV